MSVQELWTNADGLQVRFGTEGSAYSRVKAKIVKTEGNVNELVLDFTYSNLPGFDADADNDGTLDSFDVNNEYIPANSFILDSRLYAISDWTGTSTPTMTIGLYQRDGTVIDADGIDATIAEAALDTGDVVACDGALATNIGVGANDAFVRVVAAAGTYTAGRAKLVIRFTSNN